MGISVAKTLKTSGNLSTCTPHSEDNEEKRVFFLNEKLHLCVQHTKTT